MRFALTAGAFALVLALVGTAAATKAVVPLFVAWVPLVSLGWALSRPEPGEQLEVPSLGGPSSPPGPASPPE